ncbi:HAD family hydrolase [Leucobacter sp. cx-328]|uniref:HAD family hydrolase n=1 Tax=unclassified Leucobacter TaxID=2621730 RepID=UPI00165E2156|nr:MULTISPECIES: HAD family hydrolase [unclassified Leucobacter]MBC9945094.1 HAD family hydrolase [Leucobacter sp. cx-328]
MAPSIVFDFDGTLATGHGPVREYARIVAPLTDAGFADRVETELEQFDAGLSSYRDGYDIVGSLARASGITVAETQTAYDGSREALGTQRAPVSTMPDLAGFLAGLAQSATLVLATNAPNVGVDRVLDSWGVREYFTELHFVVGKPAGLIHLVSRLRESGPVLAIGDIAEFDLAPASELGADTALVGATAPHSPASVTMRGASLADIRPEIEAWAATAASSTRESLDSETAIER